MKYIAIAIAALTAFAAQPTCAEDSPFSVASFEVGDVFLYTAPGPCQGMAHLARGVNKDGGENTGCWLPAGPYIQIAWLKGTVDRIPVRDFKKPETL
jgi:hypothetical protein